MLRFTPSLSVSVRAVRGLAGPVRRLAGRAIHTVPVLENVTPGSGIEGLFSAKAVDLAWFQYQQHLVDRVNALVTDVPDYEGTSSMFEVMTQALANGPDAHSRQVAAASSQAYNNEFFFRALRASKNPGAVVGPQPLTDAEEFTSTVYNMPISTEELNKPAERQRNYDFIISSSTSLPLSVEAAFDSALAFRELLVNRADAMFGNGYMWVILHNTKMAAVNTYNWASPHASRQATEEASKSMGISMAIIEDTVTSFYPVLCLNAWQHVYLTDYGVAGKRRYLRNLFDAIDWDVVDKRFQNSRIERRKLSDSWLN